MVDGRTFSPADSDTKKAKGITQRHTVKYASTLMPKGKKGQHRKQQHESRNAKKQIKKGLQVKLNLLLRKDNTPVQSTGRPYNGLPPPTLKKNSKKKDGNRKGKHKQSITD